jgi:serine/threonine protein kinase
LFAFLWLRGNFFNCILDRGRDSSSVLKIADFGVSKELHLNPMRTCCGSPDYIAPEIITQKEGYDGKLADLWVRIFAEAFICLPLLTVKHVSTMAACRG